ncbi:TPA: thr operon leader peptide [Salmonella enterica subsp. enterica serovar Orion]|nr:thr operon leader peptide [Salmonella enterica subsp. enterica serovar Orion]HEC9156782.1 thr operon leader peptide [Salmonella enterica subsp. enterica serovar Orion]HEC9174075.1 thr operon leader peptide [Salmonella enterica subsp. enterica serovar Orion]
MNRISTTTITTNTITTGNGAG